MPKTKIDSRIRTLIESGIQANHRSLFIVIGEECRSQIAIFHSMLAKASFKSSPNVLWCYKHDLGFSSFQKKSVKNAEKKIKTGKLSVAKDDAFELFIASTNIRYCYYSQTQKILGNTYNMCILQDFEGITPNVLARTIETIEGGGLILILLKNVDTLKHLHRISMDIHEKYITESHKHVVGRFNERFILSLVSCSRCLVVDDKFTVLPICRNNTVDYNKKIDDCTNNDNGEKVQDLKLKLRDSQPVSSIINICKTLDQCKVVLKFIEIITEKTLDQTVSLMAARGRGKSAALGISVAAAIAFGYSNIYVTSPTPENLKTFFEFVCKGFDSLGYQEHRDFGLIQSTNPEYRKALVRINVFKSNRQTVQYIEPSDYNKLSHAELLVIDEAAAIPLPLVKNLMGSYLIFMASTVNGYEGTGRSLSLKLVGKLRKESSCIVTCNSALTSSGVSVDPASNARVSKRKLFELTLNESIRYGNDDAIESWLYDLLCLDVLNVEPIIEGAPPPEACSLFYVNRDTLFSYHSASEDFLKRIMHLFVSSHYKNSPNDLQMMSDAPAHHIFCLLSPIRKSQNTVPDVLCAIQVCFEGTIPQDVVTATFQSGDKRGAGDLIPWTVSQQFTDSEFPSLRGMRVVRIATHPDYQRMGYASHAMSLLCTYYSYVEGCSPKHNVQSDGFIDEGTSDLEEIAPRKNLPPLLLSLDEREHEHIDYIGVSYGLTMELLKFWKKLNYLPVYIRQTTNSLTGEHTCIMIKATSRIIPSWLTMYYREFRKRYTMLLGYRLKSLPSTLATSLLSYSNIIKADEGIQKRELEFLFTRSDVERLKMYCRNLVEYHLITDLLPSLATLYFQGKLKSPSLYSYESIILLGVGLQHKSFEEIMQELELKSTGHIMGLFNRFMRHLYVKIEAVLETNTNSSGINFNSLKFQNKEN